MTWLAGITAAVVMFTAVSFGHTQAAFNMTCILAGLAIGLSVGFAIRRWRGDFDD